jgi:exodeoxyribonuclease VII large subunit
MRAATPTAAAELACQDVDVLKSQLQTLWSRLGRRMDIGLQSHAQTLDYLSRRLISPTQQIDNKKTQINGLGKRMDIALQGMFKTHQQHMLRLNSSLQQLNPKNVLARGYAMVCNETGEMINSSQQLKVGYAVNIMFEQGSADATVIHIKSD